MNERIRELAEKARKHFPATEHSGEFWVFDEGKFAELIVKDVFATIEDEGFEVYEPVIQRVKQHFGVGE